VVLLLVEHNDFADNIADERHWYYKPKFAIEGDSLVLRNVPVPTSTLRQRCVRFVRGSLYIGPRLYTALDWFLYVIGQRKAMITRLDTSSTLPPPSPPVQQEMLDVTGCLIRAVSDLCKHDSCLLVVTGLPMPPDKTSLLQQIAVEEGFPFFSLDASFAHATDSLLFEHDEHWNALGHRRAAQDVDDFLRSLGFWGKSLLVSNGPARGAPEIATEPRQTILEPAR